MSYKGSGKKFMDVVTYTGNAAVQSIGGLEFSPDLVWIKQRNVRSRAHYLFDTVRGASRYIYSNSLEEEQNPGENRFLSSFDPNGFTLDNTPNVNQDNANFVAWCWNAGDETVTNNDGSTTSTVRANQDTGFSVVKFVGSGGNGTDATVGHGLGSAPKMIITKDLDASYDWSVYHVGLGASNNIKLNLTNAADGRSDYWGGVEPDDAVFTLDQFNSTSNADGNNTIAYCWSEVPGFSKFGKYYGTSQSNGPFVYTGFKPRFVMIKNITNNGNDWAMIDTVRGTSNILAANELNQEKVDTDGSIAVRSNGFQLVNLGSDFNGDGEQYIYMAFAEQPFGKAQKKQLTFESTQDFKEVLNSDTLTQYPNATASGVVDTQDRDNSTIDVYTDGLSEDFQINANQTFTKPVTPPSSKRWTWGAWVKRSQSTAGDVQHLHMSSLKFNDDGEFYFYSDGKFRIYHTSQMDLLTTEKFNDPSAWMHILISYDTVSGDGVKLYINGKRVTKFDINTQPSVGTAFPINSTGNAMEIGVRSDNASGSRFSGYMADIQFVDGQAMTPDEFIYNNTTREDQLYPTRFSEWFGTRGYRLPMYGQSLFEEPLASSGIVDGAPWADTIYALNPSWEASGTSSAFAFDGNPSTSYRLDGNNAGAGGQIYWDVPAGAVSGGSVVRIESTSYSSGSGPFYYVFFADGSGMTQQENIARFLEFTVPAGTSLTRLSTQAAVTYPYNADVLKITVDGVELTGNIQNEALNFTGGAQTSLLSVGDEVIATGLEIKPANVWSNYVTVNGPHAGGSSPENLFDGVFNTYVAGTASPEFTIWSPPNGISGKLFIYGQNVNSGSLPITIDGVDYAATNQGTINGNTYIELPYVENARNIQINGILPSVISFGSPDNVILNNQPITGVSKGTVGSVNGPTVVLSYSTGGWVAGRNVRSNTYNYITDLHDKNYLSWSKTNLDETDWGVDTPNNYGEDNGLGGEVRGNYATLNQLDLVGVGAYLTNGNLEFIGSSNYGVVRSTLSITTKTYWETTVPAIRTYHLVGMVPNDVTLVTDGSSRIGFSAIYGKSASVYAANYNMWYNASASVAFANEISPGDIIGHAYDPATGEYTAYHNGAPLGTLTLDAGQQYHSAVMDAEPSNFNLINFGATPFVYPAPVGYKTLNTTNIEDGLIVPGKKAMDVVLYTGNSYDNDGGGSSQSIGGLSFSPDLVWIKGRDVENNHHWFDTVRGANKLVYSDSAVFELDTTSNPTLTSFDSNGFTIGKNQGVNQLDKSFVAWCWDAGDSTVLNTSGNIASQVRANPLAGFSIVTATCNTNDQIGHGLGVAPSMIIAKSMKNSSWYVQIPDAMDVGQTLTLDGASGIFSDNIWWGLPTSTTIKFNSVNSTSPPSDWVFYCWSEVPGYSKFGKVGSSQDERFVNTGFKPRYVLFKHSTDSTDWFIFDSERNPKNPMVLGLSPNNTTVEQVTNAGDPVEFYNNGFKLWNAGAYNSDYVYMAFAEMPVQYLPQ